MISLVIAAAAALAWAYLLTCRGRFWRTHAGEHMACSEMERKRLPGVVAIIPARNEAQVIGTTLTTLLEQRYNGELRVVLVDDRSEDGTAVNASSIAQRYNAGARVAVVRGGPLPDGWTGKLWAMQQGLEYLDRERVSSEFILFTDADIRYERAALSGIVERALTHGLVLTSLMAKLRCVSTAERWFIPAFIFFFQMLYPFAWVQRSNARTAAAAGGCMLVRRSALGATGGLHAIRDALIDDCALARQLKQSGPIWLGLTHDVASVREYPRIADIGPMVMRTAYAQLRFSPLLLTATTLAMMTVFVAPPVLLAFGSAAAKPLALFAWLAMAAAFQPTLRFYRVSRWYGVALPLISAFYVVFTQCSAYQHLRGRSGAWKGRTYRRTASRATR